MKTSTKILTICSILILSSLGCQPALVNLPNLKLPDCPVTRDERSRIVEQQVCPEASDERSRIATQIACPKLDIPEAVPKNLIIEIRDGKALNLDANGELLLRQYLATRKAIKAQWAK